MQHLFLMAFADLSDHSTHKKHVPPSASGGEYSGDIEYRASSFEQSTHPCRNALGHLLRQ